MLHRFHKIYLYCYNKYIYERIEISNAYRDNRGHRDVYGDRDNPGYHGVDNGDDDVQHVLDCLKPIKVK